MGSFTDQHIAALQVGLRDRQSVGFQVQVGFWCLQAFDLGLLRTGFLDFLDLTTGEPSAFCVVGSVECRAARGSIDRPFVHDHGILHVVAVKGHDCDNEVLAAWAVIEVGGLHGAVRVMERCG